MTETSRTTQTRIDAEKEYVLLALTDLTVKVGVEALRIHLLYRAGRKIAPQIFSSYGRTYTIARVASLLFNHRPAKTDAKTKARMEELKAKVDAAKVIEAAEAAAFEGTK